ncbi:RND family efflux transporter MFP subunit [Variovorax sp. TBS-050B]|uniref:efflux RND transporter periplasmic adaptor subunit n=1 Tax=Variovorax sp. TBS-050B TaxID=2940551 RepID=UPI002473DAB4|nr:efflux RND transporter periplasmic adaptor subunit [Variovorax sp. TBS-050B]MDH6593095.1 RND family efflux transporter MFP subunit [Variovorax sp. TBS-050B]
MSCLKHKKAAAGLALAWLAWPALAQTDEALHAEGTRGVLRAQHEAVLASSISERIVRMPLREGDRFQKGQTLVAFDCSRLQAELRAAQAGQAAEARNAQVQAELLAMQAAGRVEAEIARHKETERTAQVDTIRARMVGCRVVAPFSGRVVETFARPHETPPANERLLHIVSDGALELHVVVPSRWLGWLRAGSAMQFRVDETGDLLQAEVKRIAAAVDAVSQTVKVVASVPHAPAGVLPGMSGRVVTDRPPAPGLAVAVERSPASYPSRGRPSR